MTEKIDKRTLKKNKPFKYGVKESIDKDGSVEYVWVIKVNPKSEIHIDRTKGQILIRG